MAFANKEIRNPRTGQSIRFIRTAKDTGGALLEMESVFEAQSSEPPSHYHPYQQEEFTVLEGTLTIRLAGEIKILQVKESLHIPANTVHSMWNESGRKTVVNWKVIPALNSEYLLETVAGLAQDGKTDKKGVPGILQIAVTMLKFANAFRLERPPFIIQKTLFIILLPVALLLGYKPTYRHHLD